MSGTRLDPRPYLSILARIDREYPAEERGDVLVCARVSHTLN